MNRSDFLDGVAGGVALLLPVASASSTDSRVDIVVDEPIGRINPNLYGHFTENLGAIIYDGVWVGEGSSIPNVHGVRKALIDAMLAVRAPVIRFPGGCYADSYDWRDGIGPRSTRPRRMNFWTSTTPKDAPFNQRYDTNEFGTNEFMLFCRLSGSQPYIVANLRSLPAEEFSRWVEYCNAPSGSTTFAGMRAASGSSQPFDVRYWGVGNEAWGCGGEFTPEEYAKEFFRYASAVPHFGTPLALIAAGPDKDDWEWTSRFFEAIAARGKAAFQNVYGFSLHYYSWNLSRGKTRDFDKGKGDAIRFNDVDWYELLRQGDRMESLISGHWRIMGETDAEREVKLVVDEWGSWYRPGSALTSTHLFEQLPTLRDALFTALTLDTFNRNADKIAMANCSQLINCLNSLFLAHEDKFCVTPVGHVFSMYADHHNGRAIRMNVSAPEVRYERDGKPVSFWGLNGSASLHENLLIVTIVNPHVTEARQAVLRVRGASVKEGTKTTLTSSDIHAYNSFDQTPAVVPQSTRVEETGRSIHTALPAASVTKLALILD